MFIIIKIIYGRQLAIDNKKYLYLLTTMIDNKKIKVIFFCSSQFSIQTLNELLNDDKIQLDAIITMPPAEKNRGKKISNNIVQDFALQNGFDNNFIFTPKTLKNNQDLINILREKEPDFIVVVAYGKIITKDIIDLPKYEILNLHPSALPKYRGAAPIERAIENGENEIDICIMKVDVGLDTGDVAVREKYKILQTDFADKIIPDIAKIGAKLMLKTIFDIVDKKIIFEKQREEGMIYANKIEKIELFIDLEKIDTLKAKDIYNKIRAFNNCGCCYFMLNNQRVKIVKAKFEEKNNKNNIPNYGFDKNTGRIIFKDGIIIPEILQKEGKNPVLLKDFINGLR